MVKIRQRMQLCMISVERLKIICGMETSLLFLIGQKLIVIFSWQIGFFFTL